MVLGLGQVPVFSTELRGPGQGSESGRVIALDLRELLVASSPAEFVPPASCYLRGHLTSKCEPTSLPRSRSLLLSCCLLLTRKHPSCAESWQRSESQGLCGHPTRQSSFAQRRGLCWPGVLLARHVTFSLPPAPRPLSRVPGTAGSESLVREPECLLHMCTCAGGGVGGCAWCLAS